MEKKMYCDGCGHEACPDCKKETWAMAEIEGLRCCRCKARRSMEVWKSGHPNRGEQLKLL